MRIALFITCFNDTLFLQTGQAVVRLLERLRHQVDFPLEQTCCGQMHFNTGYQAGGDSPGASLCPRLRARRSDRFALGIVREFYPRVAELTGDTDLAAGVARLLGDTPCASSAVCAAST
jgi:L-lactate dehydrogenase complex protein LldE